MYAVKAKFDGKQVHLPSVPEMKECPVIVIFEDDSSNSAKEDKEWLEVQEDALSKVWLNDENAVYDEL